MLKPPVPANEQERLAELNRYEILDTPAEVEFDELVTLASKICNAPISLISLIDSDRLFTKATVGIDRVDMVPRDITICAHTIEQSELFVIPDLSLDERFWDNPNVADGLRLRFYAGIRLVSENGYALGSLCVQDTVPKDLTEHQREALIVLGRQVMKQFELKLKNRQLEELMKIEQKQRQDLEYMYGVQQQISSIIAHDIRNPLSAIANTLSFVENNVISQSAFPAFITAANTQVAATLKLLNNLVDWGKMQLRQSDAVHDPVSLATVVEKAFEEVQSMANSKETLLINQTDTSITARVDENVTIFILRNLLTNACKFTEKGQVTVAGDYSNGCIQFTVTDNGIGMPESVSEKLFKNGIRSWRKGTRNETGSGLGLLLINEFITKSGGHIAVNSREGVGTTFQFSFPLVAS